MASANLDGLYKNKLMKMDEQKALCDKMNGILNTHMNPCAKEMCKNLRTAIAVSKKPGYFQYYERSEEVQQVEQNKTLKNLAKAIQKVGGEIEMLNEEIKQAEAAKRANALSKSTLLTGSEESGMTMAAWFEMHGRADPTPDVMAMATSFNPP